MSASRSDDEATPALRVCALGQLRIEVDGDRVEARIPDKAALALIHLADAGEPIRRSTLAGLLWSDMPEERARANLRVAMTRLRSAVGNHLGSDRGRLWIATAVDYDVAAIEGSDAADRADVVLDRYVGDFLDGASFPGAELYDDWVMARRQSIRITALAALTAAATDAHETANWSRCHELAKRVLEIEPWNEMAHRQLMSSLAATNGVAAARAQFDRCVRVLEDELGLPPSSETTALMAALAEETAAPTPIETRRAVGIPSDLTPFFGREDELDLVCTRLTSGDYRLLTIVGPGGVGKTRLAAEAARSVTDTHPDGIFFIPLASIASDAEFLGAILGAVAPDAIQSAADQRARLVELIGGARMCLVLDNFEQLVDAATSSVVGLLAGCPELRVVITSRQPLDVRGEDLFLLSGLDTPGPGDLDVGRYPAVRLLADRAYRVDKNFSLASEDPEEVGRLCRLLEGIPLHIELTAARVGPLTLSELGNMLQSELGLPGEAWRDVPDRHQTFDAVFEQSWATLDSAERHALSVLSVTRGGFDTRAATVLVGSTGHEASRLARKSLLVEEEHGRFRFHELLRQSAAMRLDDRASSERAHARWYLGLVAEAGHKTVSSEAAHVTGALLRDIDNIRTGWQHALDHGLTEDLGRAAIGVGYLFELAGRGFEGPEMTLAAADAVRDGHLTPVEHFDEAFFLRETARQIAIDTQDDTVDRLCDRIDALLQEAPGRTVDRAWADLHRAQAAFYRGDLERASELVGRSESHLTEEDELRAWTLLQRGRLHSAAGRFDDAIAIYGEALTLLEEADDVRGQALAHSYLAPAFAEQNKIWKAYEADQAAMTLAELIGNRQRMASLHTNVGASLLLLGDFEGARDHTAKAIELFRAVGDVQIEGYVLAQHAECLLGLGRTTDAEADFVKGIALTRQQGFTYGLLYNLPPWIRHLQALGRHEQALAAAEELTEIAEDRDAPHFALTGRGLASRSLAALGRRVEALELGEQVAGALASPDAPSLPWPVATHVDLAVTFAEVGDPRAAVHLDEAAAIQADTVRTITDPVFRRHYLEDLASSVELTSMLDGR